MMRLHAGPGQRRGGLRGLRVAKRGQMRVGDAGVAAVGGEMQVELALAVAQQDHGTECRK